MLTPKQEAFAQAIAKGASASEAYREAFDVAADTKIATINNSAYKLTSKPDISARIDQLKAEVAERTKITLQGHLEALGSLRNLAAKKGQYAAAITAEIARAKAAGILVDRVENSITVNSITRKIVDSKESTDG